MAGPWFMVEESSSEWHTLDTLWLSNGVTTDQARFDMRIEFEEPNNEI